MRLLPALEDADGLALVELDAAIALRVAGYPRRILLLEGFFTADELPEIAERRIAVVVHSEAQLRMLEHSRLPKPVEVFIKINSGMNRLGIAPGNVVEMV
jgi:alanine racemase